MTLIAVKIPLAAAKKVQDYIKSKDLLDTTYAYKKDKTHMHHIVKKKFRGFSKDGVAFYESDATAFVKHSQKLSLKDMLSTVLATNDLENLKTSYDIIGTIAILEIDHELRAHEQAIATALLATNPSIKTVLRKDGSHEGTFRSQKMKYLAGIDTRITTCVESGVRMRVNVETVYFSPRLSTERARIAALVQPGEQVLVMFSGAAPYPMVIARQSNAKRIVGIEINPEGHLYGMESLSLNKIKNVDLYNDDVHKLMPLMKERYVSFDRIIMPLPKTADEFLDDALGVSHDGTIIHFYDFLHEDDFSKAEKKVEKACAKNGFQSKKKGIFTCGCQGVRTYRLCLDVQIKKLI